jgi:hypothetical protein
MKQSEKVRANAASKDRMVGWIEAVAEILGVVLMILPFFQTSRRKKN